MFALKAISILSSHALILEIWRCQNLWDLFRDSLITTDTMLSVVMLYALIFTIKPTGEPTMNPYTIIESFELHEGQLENWKELSKSIDTDIAKAEGFISRDSGIDPDSRVYCIVKWESKTHQETFMKNLMSQEGSDEMMKHFGSIANMETEIRQEIDIF